MLAIGPFTILIARLQACAIIPRLRGWSRTVIVSLDLPPTITLTGSATINLLVGDTYIEDGCVATDALDGDLTSSIITSGTVDTSTVGTYTLTYSVTDSASNIVSTTRTVIVGEVCTSVTIELIDGSNSQTLISHARRRL